MQHSGKRLIGDLTHDLFDNVLDRDNPRGSFELIGKAKKAGDDVKDVLN